MAKIVIVFGFCINRSIIIHNIQVRTDKFHFYIFFTSICINIHLDPTTENCLYIYLQDKRNQQICASFSVFHIKALF